MTGKTAPYLAAAAIALSIPGFAHAQSTPPAPQGSPALPTMQAPSMNDSVAPGGLAPRGAAPSETMKQPLEAPELKGKTVFDAAGKKVGSIDEVLPQTGQARDAVVAVGGILGIGAKKVLIPASDIERKEDGRLIVAMTESQIEQLPEFERPRPSTSSPAVPGTARP